MNKNFLVLSLFISILAISLSGCFIDTDFRTECYQRYIGTRCDIFGCEDIYEEECIEISKSYPEPGCFRHSDCPNGYDCQNRQCIQVSGGVPLCGACTDSVQCNESGAACSLLASGEQVCTRACNTINDCPNNFLCLKYASGIQQCVPSTDSCKNLDIACNRHEDCRRGEVCYNGLCTLSQQGPNPTCTHDSQCFVSERCINGVCSRIQQCQRNEDCGNSPYAVCLKNTGECTTTCQGDIHCRSDQRCFSGYCLTNKTIQCRSNLDCQEGICYDARCELPCNNTSECGNPNFICSRGICVYSGN